MGFNWGEMIELKKKIEKKIFKKDTYWKHI